MRSAAERSTSTNLPSPPVPRPLLWRAEYADKEQQETAVRTTDLEWTIVRLAWLTDGPATDRYRACEGIWLDWRSPYLARRRRGLRDQ